MKMRLLESIATVILAFVLFIMAVDSDNSEATRIVSAVFFVGLWISSKLSEIIQRMERNGLHQLELRTMLEARLDAISSKLYEALNR